MYAEEFQIVIDKPYIKIPEYKRFKGHKVRIVLLDIQEERETNFKSNTKEANKRLDYFDKYQLDLSNFNFDREEAHER
jgi:ribosome maturation factor RimP